MQNHEVDGPQATPSVILLAAGRGSRMGSSTERIPKALLEVGGRPVLDWILDAILARTTGEIVVVLGHGAQLLSGHLAARYGDRVRTAVNARYREDVNILSVELGVRALAYPERGYLVVETDLLVDDRVWDLVFERMRVSSDSFWVCRGAYAPGLTGGIVRTRVGDAIDAIDYQPVYRPEFEGWRKMLGMLYVGPGEVDCDRRFRQAMLDDVGQYYMRPWIVHLGDLPCRALQVDEGFAASFNTPAELDAAARAFLAQAGADGAWVHHER